MALVRTKLERDRVVLDAPNVSALELPLAMHEGRRINVEVWSNTCEAIVFEPSGEWLSRALGRRGWLVYMPEDVLRPVNPKYARAGDVVSFADAYPVLAVGQGSLDDLNARLEAPVTVKRFRPNIVVAGGAPFVEDTWDTVRIGERRFRGVKRCDRCTIVTIDPDAPLEGNRVEPLRTLAKYRSQDNRVWFGMNLVPDDVGPLRVGDAVSR